MTKSVALFGCLCLMALAACDQPKSRNVPFDPMAAGPAPEAIVVVPGEGLSVGLPKRSGFPGVFLDHAGAATDPMARQPAVTPADQPMVFDGFAYDPLAKQPAKGVDVVIDGHVYATTYGRARQDVARFTKVPELVAVGFKTVLPAGTLAPGPHSVTVRVIAADGKGYFEGPPIPFQVK